jgi:aminoglycoside phosphotransferase (APT) family kinase protein
MELMLKERLNEETALRTCLEEIFAGRSVRIVDHEQLKIHVHRLRVEVDGAERSLVGKWSDPAVAHRCWLVARRWLPAAGLEDVGPSLLGVSAARSCEGTWHVYDHLLGRPLSTELPVAADVQAAIDAIARVHTSFAEHPLIPEFRHWGGDRGIHFYSSNLRDAAVALRSADLARRGADAIASRDALLERIHRLQDQEPVRAQALADQGGPETLVHGDLWPTNTIVLPDGEAPRVRLIDWDEAAVGPIGFDLSTFLLRFDQSDRWWILDAYRRAVGRLAEWELPPERELNLIFETAAYARLANLLAWSFAGDARGDADWLPERLADMVEWLDAVEPVLPSR